MLKRLKKYLFLFLDIIFPKRDNYNIVEKLSESEIIEFPLSRITKENFIHPLFQYKDKRVKAIIWELKYRSNQKHLGTIGKLMYEQIIEELSNIYMFDSDAEFAMIPIPITGKRRSERGYNQSEYISRAILENDTHRSILYAPQWLQKIKETPKQSWLDRQHRIKNLSGSFLANERVRDKYIVLVDDVVTTGATLIEARRELFSKGAKNILAFTIAH